MVYGRSTLEILEDAVLDAQEHARSLCISREDAVRYSIDISRNQRMHDFIVRGDELIDAQDTMDINDWMNKAESYAWAVHSLS